MTRSLDTRAFAFAARCRVVRAILYTGTRGCSTTLADALREHLDPVLVVTPADPRALGKLQDAPGIDGDCRAWAQLLLDRALEEARGIADQSRQALGQVFGDAGRRQAAEIDGYLAPARLEETLPAGLDDTEATELWASREALELLQAVGIDVADGLARRGIDLEVR